LDVAKRELAAETEFDRAVINHDVSETADILLEFARSNPS
jgi:guanylate kinase